MSRKINIFVIGVLLFAVPVLAQNPMRSATEPPTHTESGLLKSRNPIDAAGNRIITGNVGGGKHFRGDVPYNSQTEFGDQTSSTYLNPFLRRSAGSDISGNYTGKVAPYYNYWSSPGKSKTKGNGLYQKQNYRINDRLSGYKAPSSIYRENGGYISEDRRQFNPGYNARYSGVKTSPMNYNQRTGKKSLSEKYGQYESSEYIRGRAQLTAEQNELLAEILKVDAQRIDDRAPDLKVKKPADQGSEQQDRNLEDFKTKTDRRTYQKPHGKHHVETDSFDPISEQLQLLQKQLEELEKDRTMISPKRTDAQSYRRGATKESTISKKKEKQTETKKYSGGSGAGRDFDSFIGGKFSENIEKAEKLLKQGRYYAAADIYSTAMVYNPESAIAVAGRAHALFGAGEYMSTALFLSRALTLSPDYPREKIDIVERMGGRDIIETRIAEAEKWVKDSENNDLHFILSYFYYRLGRFDKARQHIDDAREKRPNVKVYDNLKKVIDEAASKR